MSHADFVSALTNGRVVLGIDTRRLYPFLLSRNPEFALFFSVSPMASALNSFSDILTILGWAGLVISVVLSFVWTWWCVGVGLLWWFTWNRVSLRYRRQAIRELVITQKEAYLHFVFDGLAVVNWAERPPTS